MALVLGAGGVLGSAFHAVALRQLRRQTGWDPASADLLVGTSAGSVAAGLLRAGMTVEDLCARYDGGPMSARGREIGAVLPLVRPRHSTRSGSDQSTVQRGLSAFATAMRDPLRVRPASVAAAFLPRGTVSSDWMAAAFDAVLERRWPTPPLWVCTVRADTGRRQVHGGRDQGASPGRAIAASCAVPGMFRPVRIDGAEHFDGGTHSPTNLDVLALWRPDVVVVISPMSGSRPPARADLPMRLWARGLLAGERAVLGLRTTVVVIEPRGRVLEAMGTDLMAAERRAEFFQEAASAASEVLPDSVAVLERLAAARS